MTKRKITKIDNLKFKPFDRYGKVIPGMSWHLVSYDKKTQYGTYISKLEPGTKPIPHIHPGYEEFMILEGELIDSDGTIFKKGDPADGLYIVGKGSVGIYFPTNQTMEKPDIVRKANEILGEMGVIDMAPRMATATALE